MKSIRFKRKIPSGSSLRRKASPLGYAAWSGDIAALLEEARRQASRSVNAILTATYWEIGRRIVEFIQQGKVRAEYGDEAIRRLSHDLTLKFGRGFGYINLGMMRRFFLAWPPESIVQTLSEQFGRLKGMPILQTLSKQFPTFQICQTPSNNSLIPTSAVQSQKTEFDLAAYLEALGHVFPLSWSHYVRLLSVDSPEGRRFYETESLRGGWSVRQLDRQISTLFYERTALAKNKAALLINGAKARPEDIVTVEEEIKNPYVLEFLNLRDDYAENDLEDALVRHLEAFLLEMGNGFTFVARQKRIRVGKEWYRMDLLLFHRRLRCLVVIDLKIGRLTHADAGQMNLYVNYAAENLALAGENPPVGLVLCSEHDEAVAHYSLGNLRNKIMAAEYKLNLPEARLLEKEIAKTRRLLESPVRRKLKT